MRTLFDKVWAAHEVVAETPDTPAVLYIDLHLIHEVTSPQAFSVLKSLGLPVRRPDRTLATMDHSTPTSTDQVFGKVPIKVDAAAKQVRQLEQNAAEFGVELFGMRDARRGIVHVISPELGATQPGMTIVCGDSHTSTHGAFGAIAMGIGTSQVRDVLASQCLALEPLKVRRIDVNGKLSPGVYAKDVILTIIRKLGVQGGAGFAYEYGGTTVDRMSMDERMTMCNMSIEGAARAGYVNPDDTTFDYLKGRQYAPAGAAWDKAVAWWRSISSDKNASYDDRVSIDAPSIEPTVTWGINPGQSVGITERIPANADAEALAYMGFDASTPIRGTRIDVAFIGSCTNGRLSDIEEAARIVRGHKVAKHVKALMVPGSRAVAI